MLCPFRTKTVKKISHVDQVETAEQYFMECDGGNCPLHETKETPIGPVEGCKRVEAIKRGWYHDSC